MKDSLEEARIAAARGAALLDARVPDWWDCIDTDVLCMNNCCACILGQLYGRYAEGRTELDAAAPEYRVTDRMGEFGFNTSDAFALPASAAYRNLDTAWRELIAQRRQATLPPADTKETPS